MNTIEVHYERCLACAVRTQERNPLTLLDFEIYTKESLVPIRIGESKPCDV
jgi:hypothetical protein